MRAFVAIPVPDAVVAALEPVQDRLPVGTLVDADALHLTLTFLGEQPNDALEEVHHALARIAAQPFALQVRGLGTFGARAPRVVWAGADGGAALADLRDRVRGAVRQAGIELRRERFRPHVTLARIGGRLLPEELEKLRLFLERFAGFPAPPFEVTHFVLYRSVPTKSGVVYDPLVEYPLVRPDAAQDPHP